MWEQRTVAEVAAHFPNAVNGGPFGSKLGRKDYVSQGVPVIRGANLSSDRRFSYEGFVYVTREKAEELRANLAKPKDVVVTQRGTIGQVGIIPAASPFPCYVVSQSQMKVTVNEELAEPAFIYYSLRSPRSVRRLQDLAMSAGVPHINLEMFRAFTIQLPPLSTQRKIVAVLAAYDELIENNLRRIEILEEMAQAVYREWFVNFRYPGHDDVALVDSPLGRLPEGWVPTSLQHCARKLVDGDWIETKDQGGADFRLLQVSNVGIGRFRETGNYRYVTQSTFERLRCTEIKVGDILISRMPEPVGRAWLVDFLAAPAVTAVDVAILTPRSHAIGMFLDQYLNSPATLSQVAAVATGTTRLRVTRRVLAQMELALPPDALLEPFARLLQPNLDLRRNLVRQNANLRSARDLLLPKLVSGEIDVSDLDIDTSWLAA